MTRARSISMLAAFAVLCMLGCSGDSVTVTAPPSITVTYPTAGSTVPGTFYVGYTVANWAVSPTGRKINLIVDGGAPTPITDTSFHMVMGLLAAGNPHTLRLELVNADSSLAGVNHQVSFNVDETPGGEITSPGEGASTSAPFDVRFKTENWLIAPAGQYVRLRVDGAPSAYTSDQFDPDFTFTGKFSNVNLAAGPHTLQLDLMNAGGTLHSTVGTVINITVN